MAGELALPGDVAAARFDGPAGFGEVVAMIEGEAWIAGGGTLLRPDGESMPGAWSALWAGGEALGGIPGQGVFSLTDGELLQALPSSVAIAGDPGGWAWADAEGVHHPDGRRWELPGVRQLAFAEGRILAVACSDPGCLPYLLEDGGPRALESSPSAGVRVAIHGGLACWSLPRTEVDDDPGVVRCEDGDELVGEVGDHLGMGLGGGFASTTTNSDIQPNRARVRDLEGGPTLALDRAAWGSSLPLAADAEHLLVGIPAWTGEGALHGGALLVRRDSLSEQ